MFGIQFGSYADRSWVLRIRSSIFHLQFYLVFLWYTTAETIFFPPQIVDLQRHNLYEIYRVLRHQLY